MNTYLLNVGLTVWADDECTWTLGNRWKVFLRSDSEINLDLCAWELDPKQWIDTVSFDIKLEKVTELEYQTKRDYHLRTQYPNPDLQTGYYRVHSHKEKGSYQGIPLNLSHTAYVRSATKIFLHPRIGPEIPFGREKNAESFFLEALTEEKYNLFKGK